MIAAAWAQVGRTLRDWRLSAETPVDSRITSMARKSKRLRFVVQEKKG